jgi:hypothetical protein
MLDPKLVAAKWYVGELSGKEMTRLAGQALELGHDGKNLRCLAGLSGPARRNIVDIVDGAMYELGVNIPITKQDAALWMARHLAAEILAGRIEPYAGACRIWLSYSPSAPELDHWRNLVIDYEAAAEAGGLESANQRIIQAAHDLFSSAK